MNNSSNKENESHIQSSQQADKCSTMRKESPQSKETLRKVVVTETLDI